MCALWRFRQMNCSQKLQVKKFKGFIWSFLRFSTTSSKGQCLLQFGECFVKFAVVSREDMRLYSTLSLRLLQFLFLSNRSRSSRSYSWHWHITSDTGYSYMFWHIYMLLAKEYTNNIWWDNRAWPNFKASTSSIKHSLPRQNKGGPKVRNKQS